MQELVQQTGYRAVRLRVTLRSGRATRQEVSSRRSSIVDGMEAQPPRPGLSWNCRAGGPLRLMHGVGARKGLEADGQSVGSAVRTLDDLDAGQTTKPSSPESALRREAMLAVSDHTG